MIATSRLIVYERRRALEKLLHVVGWHIHKGTALPQDIVDAVREVEEAVLGPKEPPSVSLPSPRLDTPPEGKA